MKGMILAAGVGSRLYPITGVLPKPMVPVVDKPVMQHAVEMLVRGGVTDIKANLHHLPHLIEQHFGNGARWGARLTYSLENSLLGTAGAVKRVQRFFDDTFVVTVADSVWDLDVAAAVAYHRAKGALATVVVKRMPIAEIGRFGVVRVDDEGRIREFQEKPRPEEACSDLASTGFYILEPEVLERVPPGEFFDFARDLFPRLLAEGAPFYALPYDGPWSDIGTFEEYARVHQHILRGEYTQLLLPAAQRSPGVYIGHHVKIHPEAELRPPVFIGSYTRVMRGATVGPNTVLGSHSIVGEDAHVSASITGPHTYVGRMTSLHDCLAHRRWVVKLDNGRGLYVEDSTLLADTRSRTAARWLARGFDLVLAGTGLLGAAPLMLGLNLTGRILGEQPIQREWRLRADPRPASPGGTPRLQPFQLLRFSDEGRVGRLAARLGVARLPGLFNVVRGDLSLVGTRPLTEEEAARIPDDWRAHVYQSPAGLTGFWDLQDEPPLSTDEALAIDAYGAASKGVRQDLGVLWHVITRRARKDRSK